jgi:hypothetical protein
MKKIKVDLNLVDKYFDEKFRNQISQFKLQSIEGTTKCNFFINPNKYFKFKDEDYNYINGNDLRLFNINDLYAPNLSLLYIIIKFKEFYNNDFKVVDLCSGMFEIPVFLKKINVECFGTEIYHYVKKPYVEKFLKNFDLILEQIDITDKIYNSKNNFDIISCIGFSIKDYLKEGIVTDETKLIIGENNISFINLKNELKYLGFNNKAKTFGCTLYYRDDLGEFINYL